MRCVLFYISVPTYTPPPSTTPLITDEGNNGVSLEQQDKMFASAKFRFFQSSNTALLDLYTCLIVEKVYLSTFFEFFPATPQYYKMSSSSLLFIIFIILVSSGHSLDEFVGNQVVQVKVKGKPLPMDRLSSIISCTQISVSHRGPLLLRWCRLLLPPHLRMTLALVIRFVVPATGGVPVLHQVTTWAFSGVLILTVHRPIWRVMFFIRPFSGPASL